MDKLVEKVARQIFEEERGIPRYWQQVKHKYTHTAEQIIPIIALEIYRDLDGWDEEGQEKVWQKYLQGDE